MADIRGFTQFSQSVEPSKATKTLQEILKLLHESIYALQGDLSISTSAMDLWASLASDARR